MRVELVHLSFIMFYLWFVLGERVFKVFILLEKVMKVGTNGREKRYTKRECNATTTKRRGRLLFVNSGHRNS